MKRWRKHIICLVLVTFPMSLWAAVAAPKVCDSMQAPAQAQTAGVGHAHHGSPMVDPEPVVDQHHPDAPDPCCDSCLYACLSACLAGNLSALSLSLATLQPAVHTTHYNLLRATQFLPGPSYPSLYRPPISHI
jgi:hypothetical protein